MRQRRYQTADHLLSWGFSLLSLSLASTPSPLQSISRDIISMNPTEPSALRSIRPLKVSTRDFSWGKDGQFFWLTTYHPCSAETSRKSGALIYPEPLGPPRPVAGYLSLSRWDQNASLQISCSLSISHSAVRHYKFRVTYIQHRKINNEKTAALIIFRFFLCKMGKCCIQTYIWCYH